MIKTSNFATNISRVSRWRVQVDQIYGFVAAVGLFAAVAPLDPVPVVSVRN